MLFLSLFFLFVDHPDLFLFFFNKKTEVHRRQGRPLGPPGALFPRRQVQQAAHRVQEALRAPPDAAASSGALNKEERNKGRKTRERELVICFFLSHILCITTKHNEHELTMIFEKKLWESCGERERKWSFFFSDPGKNEHRRERQKRELFFIFRSAIDQTKKTFFSILFFATPSRFFKQRQPWRLRRPWLSFEPCSLSLITR